MKRYYGNLTSAAFWKSALFFLMMASYVWLSAADGGIPETTGNGHPGFAADTTADTSLPYRFHLYIVLRKKYRDAQLTVRDTLDSLLMTRHFDSLVAGRNFFNVPMKDKLPPVVLWEVKAENLNKKGRMAIH